MRLLKKMFSDKKTKDKSPLTCPAIFIPGSSAGKNRFDLTFKMLGINPKKVLKLRINADQVISTRGIYQGYVVISFDDNRDGHKNIQKQAELLDSAFAYLLSKYDFQEFNAIGHSNGGLNWTIFLEKYFKKYKKKINNLVTIGSPFNLRNRRGRKSAMLSDLIANRKKLPRDMDVYTIIGLDDGFVTPHSAYSARDVFHKRVANFTQLTVSGFKSHHSILPHNQDTVNLLAKILRI
ncbi:alpha/beta hydrolase [Streptococcaceae bacterium ESL0687]|nr:alpha/beta hydrolase [Streptococcaceae bacterium ESL0687]